MSPEKTSSNVLPGEIVAFWLAAGHERWFEQDDAFDDEVRRRFEPVYGAAAAGLLGGWEGSAQDALALVIVLDQFPRNMYRGSARAYAADPLARAVATRAIASGFDQEAAMPVRVFFYLPFEHSENLADQERSVALVHAAGDADLLEWAELHAGIIRRFGRFPHRNAVLGRTTTAEEQAFLDGGGFRG